MPGFHVIERAYRTAIAANRALLRASSEAEFATEICRIAVEEAGYALAWVGYAEHDARKSVRPCAQYGFDDGYVSLAAVTWNDGERGQGPTGTAIRTGKPQVARHIATDPRFAPWRDDALRRGYASSASFPLRDGDTAFGALNLYAREPDGFDADEVELLSVVSDDLAYGILRLRGSRAFSASQTAVDHADRLVAVGSAAATLAHDVNNHLTTAILAIEHAAVRASVVDSATLQEAIDAIDRAVALNRDLLLVAGKSPVKPTRFVLDGALRDLEPALRRACGTRVTLRVELGAGGACVSMDPRALAQIVTNLVVNARDALVSGGTVGIATTVVELSHPMTRQHAGLSPGAHVSIRVTDDGTGIAPDVLARVFEPFFTTKGERGTGLGLASALGSAHQAGGGISVETAVGKGTTFEVLLPLAEELRPSP